MFYRNATLLDTHTIATAATKEIDLDLKDIISRILIVLEVTNTSYTPTNHPLACLKTIEIVDGSKVLFSLTGYEAQALSYYHNGVMDHNELNYENKAICRAAVSINFGRHLYDEMFAFDPNKYRNPQLKIEHDKALGGCLPTTGSIRVLADCFDEKVISPVGYLGAKEIFSFTPTQGTPEPISLPTDDVIRMLLPMNTNDNEEPDIQFETIKLDEDDGKRIIFDGYTMDLIRMEAARRDRFSEYLSGSLIAATRSFYLTACKDIQNPLILQAGDDTYFWENWSGGRVRVFDCGASCYVGGLTTGRCPHGAVPMFFGKQDNPDDWWDASKVGKARLTLTPRATADSVPGCDTNKTTDLVGQFAVKY